MLDHGRLRMPTSSAWLAEVLARAWLFMYVLLRMRTFPAWLVEALARAWPFMAVSVIAGVAMAAAACVAAARQWRLVTDKRLILWILGGVLLILWASATWQLGSNLTAEAKFAVRPPNAQADRVVAKIVAEGDRGAMVLYAGRRHWIPADVQYSVCLFDLSGERLNVGPEVPLVHGEWPGYGAYAVPPVAWSADRPQRAYALLAERVQKDNRTLLKALSLATVAFDAGRDAEVIHTLDLLDSLGDEGNFVLRMVLHGGRIYVHGFSKLAIIDLADPDGPELSRVLDTPGWVFRTASARTGPHDFAYESVPLLAIEDISSADRLAISLRLASAGSSGPGRQIATDGDLMVVVTREGLTTYRVAGTDNGEARLELLGWRQATLLERGVRNPALNVALRGGLAYVVTGKTGMTVYDVSDPTRPRRARHFASPDQYFFAVDPLPDGRTLLAGEGLFVLSAAR